MAHSVAPAEQEVLLATTFAEYRYLVRSDLYRLNRDVSFANLLKQLVLGEAFTYIFWYRTCRYARQNRLTRLLVFPFALWLMRHHGFRLGINIPYQTDIGPGFYISHFTGVFVNSRCTIGKNCNLSQGVTLGLANRGPRKGVPTLGDNVYLGPGAKVVGAVHIGDNVAVGANAVVTRDLPANAVAVGIPARVISHEGSTGYVARTAYESVLGPYPHTRPRAKAATRA